MSNLPSLNTSDFSDDISIELHIGGGSFERGFYIWSLIYRNGKLVADSKKNQDRNNIKTTRQAPEIPELYEQWKNAYTQIARQPRSKRSSEFTIPPQTEYYRRLAVCSQAAIALEEYLDIWFHESHSFSFLRQWISLKLSELKVSSPNSLPLIFQIYNVEETEKNTLKKLPWHLWDLFSDFPGAEMVINASVNQLETVLRNPIRILAVFGSTEGVDLNEDLQELRRLHCEFEAEVVVLPTDVNENELDELRRSYGNEIEILPKHNFSSASNQSSDNQLGGVRTFLAEIHDQLTQSYWDILFFAGHSYSRSDLTGGYLVIGRGGNVPISALRTDLKEAVRRGLKLAIFNSCDGLGIAEQLVKINVPTVVVFREPAPDQIAHDFLRIFLRKFSGGAPFYKASREARQALQWREKDPEDPYPCASWLPVIYQNHTQPEWIWPQYTTKPQTLLGRLSTWLARIWNAILRIPGSVVGLISLALLVFALVVFYRPITELLTPNSGIRDQIQSYVIDPPPNDDIERQISVLAGEGRNRPIAFINLLNDLSSVSNQEVYRIAVVAEDIEVNPKADEQLLRGIAQMQLEQNCQIDFENSNELDIRNLQRACGTAGIKIFVDLRSDYANQDNAINLAKDFASPDILAVVGFSNSKTTFAANSILESKSTIIVSPTSTAVRSESLLDRKTGKYVFRTATNDSIATQTLVQFINNISLENKLIAVVYEKGEPYSDSFTQEFASKIGNANVVVLPECNLATFPQNSSLGLESKSAVFASQCLDAIEQNVPKVETLLLVPGTKKTSSALAVVREILQDQNSQFSYLLGSDTMYEDELRNVFADFYQRNRPDKTRMVVAIPWSREQNFDLLSSSAFQKKAKFVWGTDAINWQTVTSYDAVRTIIEAFKFAKQNGKPDRDGLYSAIASDFSIDGATAKIQFNDGDRRQESDLGVLVQVQPTQQGADFFKLQ